MQVSQQSLFQESSVPRPKYCECELDSTQIDSSGLLHLIKADWNMKEGLMLCRELLTKAETRLGQAAAAGSTKLDGEAQKSSQVKIWAIQRGTV